MLEVIIKKVVDVDDDVLKDDDADEQPVERKSLIPIMGGGPK